MRKLIAPQVDSQAVIVERQRDRFVAQLMKRNSILEVESSSRFELVLV
jgi:hypothetical protein